MASDTRPTKQHVDADGVRIVEISGVRTRVWLLAGALGLVGLAVYLFVRPVMEQRANQVSARVEGHTDADGRSIRRAQSAGQPPHEARALPTVAAGEAPDSRAAIPPTRAVPDAQGSLPSRPGADAGTEAPAGDEPQGIALFPPPGTKPIKRGIVVPDDVELPPGYVRHYQTTDAGQRLPAILMFHPDYQPVDARGNPIPLPEDRVVPPEMAPPGLPVQMLEIPPNSEVPMLEVPEENGAPSGVDE